LPQTRPGNIGLGLLSRLGFIELREQDIALRHLLGVAAQIPEHVPFLEPVPSLNEQRLQAVGSDASSYIDQLAPRLQPAKRRHRIR
jgi:hypothetical protein